MSSLSFPDFLVLGAPKAGTTAFCEYLQAHPHICLSQPKETRYFLLSSKWDRESYRQRFFQRPAGRMCGEGTPNYLGMSFVLPRLAEVAPSAQLFLLLRDPAERAFSSWWMVEKLVLTFIMRACMPKVHSVHFHLNSYG